MTTRRRWTPEEDALLRKVWHNGVKLAALIELFPGRCPEGLYDRGTLRLKLGKRRAKQDYDAFYNWKTISAQLKRKPMTAKQIAEATGISHNQVLDLLKRRHGRLVYVFDWTTQYARGGAAKIWALGDEPDAPAPAKIGRKASVKRYVQRLAKEEPEKLERWKKAQQIRDREKAGTLVKRDIAAAWF